MERLTVVEIETFLRDVGTDLQEAEQHLRDLAGGCGGVYSVTAQQRQRLEVAAELARLTLEAARTAAHE